MLPLEWQWTQWFRLADPLTARWTASQSSERAQTSLDRLRLLPNPLHLVADLQLLPLLHDVLHNALLSRRIVIPVNLAQVQTDHLSAMAREFIAGEPGLSDVLGRSLFALVNNVLANQLFSVYSWVPYELEVVDMATRQTGRRTDWLLCHAQSHEDEVNDAVHLAEIKTPSTSDETMWAFWTLFMRGDILSHTDHERAPVLGAITARGGVPSILTNYNLWMIVSVNIAAQVVRCTPPIKRNGGFCDLDGVGSAWPADTPCLVDRPLPLLLALSFRAVTGSHALVPGNVASAVPTVPALAHQVANQPRLPPPPAPFQGGRPGFRAPPGSAPGPDVWLGGSGAVALPLVSLGTSSSLPMVQDLSTDSWQHVVSLDLGNGCGDQVAAAAEAEPEAEYEDGDGDRSLRTSDSGKTVESSTGSGLGNPSEVHRKSSDTAPTSYSSSDENDHAKHDPANCLVSLGSEQLSLDTSRSNNMFSDYGISRIVMSPLNPSALAGGGEYVLGPRRGRGSVWKVYSLYHRQTNADTGMPRPGPPPTPTLTGKVIKLCLNPTKRMVDEIMHEADFLSAVGCWSSSQNEGDAGDNISIFADCTTSSARMNHQYGDDVRRLVPSAHGMWSAKVTLDAGKADCEKQTLLAMIQEDAGDPIRSLVGLTEQDKRNIRAAYVTFGRYGIVHHDAHPRNWLRSPKTGALSLVDFGSVGVGEDPLPIDVSEDDMVLRPVTDWRINNLCHNELWAVSEALRLEDLYQLLTPIPV